MAFCAFVMGMEFVGFVFVRQGFLVSFLSTRFFFANPGMHD